MTNVNDVRLKIISLRKLSGSVFHTDFLQELAGRTVDFSESVRELDAETEPDQVKILRVSFGNALHDKGIGPKLSDSETFRAELHSVLNVGADTLGRGEPLPDNARSVLRQAATLDVA